MPSRVLRGPAVPLWRDILQVLAGERRDYTVESPRRAVVLLAVPTTLEMMMESLFALVSVLCVARLGADAVAVVGLTESVMILIYAVAIGLSIPAGAMVARRIGQGDPQGAGHILGQILTLGLTLSATIGLLLAPFAEDVLLLLGATPSAVAAGAQYSPFDVRRQRDCIHDLCDQCSLPRRGRGSNRDADAVPRKRNQRGPGPAHIRVGTASGAGPDRSCTSDQCRPRRWCGVSDLVPEDRSRSPAVCICIICCLHEAFSVP